MNTNEGSMKKTARFKEGDKVRHTSEDHGVGTVVSRSGNTVGVKWKGGQRSHDHNSLKKDIKEHGDDPLSYWNDEEEPYDYDGNEDDLDYELRDKLRSMRNSRQKTDTRPVPHLQPEPPTPTRPVEPVAPEREVTPTRPVPGLSPEPPIVDTRPVAPIPPEKKRTKKKKSLKEGLYDGRDKRLYQKLLKEWTK